MPNQQNYCNFVTVRIMAREYGLRRSGVAVTDPLKISANPLPVVRTCDLFAFVTDYCKTEQVERILVGEPKQMNGQPSETMRQIAPFVTRLRNALPHIPVELTDERFTSVMAHRDMLQAGFKKSARQRKGLADEMAATIILTTWLESH